jgi:hypothetical protein
LKKVLILVIFENLAVSGKENMVGSLLSSAMAGDDEARGDLISEISIPANICTEKVTAAANKIFSHIPHPPLILIKI